MSIALNPRTTHPRWALARPAALAALLAAEGLVLSGRYDMPRLDEGLGDWAVLLKSVQYIGRLAVSIAAAAALFGGGGLGREVREALAGSARPRRLAPWLAGHAAALALFAGLTAAISGPNLAGRAYAGAWVSAWAAAGLATLAPLVVAAVPVGLGFVLARSGLRLGAAALGLGAASVAAGQLANLLWEPLTRSTLAVVRGILRLGFGGAVHSASAETIGVGGFSIRVAPQCSGYEGIGLIWVFLAAYMTFFRRELRWPRAWLLLPLGTAVIWLSNALRIAALVAIGARYSPSVAVGGFHSQAGWLAFNGVGLGLVALTRWSGAFSVDRDEAGATVNPTVPYLAPFLAIMAAAMVGTSLGGGGFDGWYPLRVAAGGLAFWACRRSYGRARLSVSPVAVGWGVLCFAVWMALEPAGWRGGTATPEALRALPPALALAWVVCRVVGSVLTVPIAEELAFRGYLTRRLVDADFERVRPGTFTALSLVGSSALFGAMHGRWLAGFAAGMIFALAYYRRGRVADAAVAHAVTNALIAALVLGGGAWNLW